MEFIHTFSLVHEYPGGRLPLAHLDLYRLQTPAQVIGAGLEAYLPYPGGVTVVEWPERWPDLRRRCGPLGPLGPHPPGKARAPEAVWGQDLPLRPRG